MRITNDDYTPIELLSELTSRSTSHCAEPESFFKGEKKKHDWLVDAWASRIDEILNCFKRYGTLVAETQSIRDQGVDVYLEFEAKGKQHRVGFQIKSALEVERDKGFDPKHSLVGALKRQAFEASFSSKFDEWWIVPCFDHIKHVKVIQQINAELIMGSPPINGMQIKLLEPRSAASFLSKNNGAIDALCTRLLCREDEVLQASRSELMKLNDFQRNCVLELIWPALAGEVSVSQRDLFDMVEDLDELADDCYALEASGFLEADDGEGYVVKPYSFPGLCALYFEGRVRHEMSHMDSAEFATRMLEDLG